MKNSLNLLCGAIVLLFSFTGCVTDTALHSDTSAKAASLQETYNAYRKETKPIIVTMSNGTTGNPECTALFEIKLMTLEVSAPNGTTRSVKDYLVQFDVNGVTHYIYERWNEETSQVERAVETWDGLEMLSRMAWQGDWDDVPFTPTYLDGTTVSFIVPGTKGYKEACPKALEE